MTVEQSMPTKLVALTGGIAAGKSTIGARLAELGAVRVDADQLARDAVAKGSRGLKRVADRFGDGLVTEAGELDRAALGAIVFADADALADLNAIVHPEVQRLFGEHLEAAREAGVPVVVYEIPLFVETQGAGRDWDVVVTAEAPVETRVARMAQLRGMAEADARARIGNQASEQDRRAVADVVIDTGGTEQETIAQVDALWATLVSSAAEGR